MGTTESILLGDDSEGDESEGGNSELPIEPASGLTRERLPARLPPRRRQTRPPPSGVGPASLGSSKPYCTLQGLVNGLPKSGKRTLLDRLRGRNPPEPSPPSETAATEPTTSDTITTPYKAPNRAWDRIQLRVSLELPPETPVDFAVLLVHPQHPRKRVEKHLRQSLRALLERQGYVRDIAGDNERHRDTSNADGGAQLPPDPTAAATPRPLCLCLLIGFRDLLGTDSAAEAALEELSGALTGAAMAVLQDYPLLEPDRLVLASGYVSLYDCFGLHRLHHFIYQAYLQRKRSDLEARLREVHAARREGAPQVEDMTYGDYLEKVVQTTTRKTSGTGSSKSAAPSLRVNGTITTLRRHIIAPDLSQQAPALEREAASPNFAADSQAALEAFLASSDSENEEKQVPRQTKPTKEFSRDEDEADEDDDAFYYQETVMMAALNRRTSDLVSPDKESELQSSKVSSGSSEHSTEDVDRTSGAEALPHEALVTDHEASQTSPSAASGHAGATNEASLVDSDDEKEAEKIDDVDRVASTEPSGKNNIISSQSINVHHASEVQASTHVVAHETTAHVTSDASTCKPRDESPVNDGNSISSHENGFIDSRSPIHDRDSDEDDDFVIENDASAATCTEGLAVSVPIVDQPIRDAETVDADEMSDEVKEALAAAKREMEQLLNVSQSSAPKKNAI